MNEQLILAIINFYEEHIQQLNNKNHIQFQKYADKENVNQMAYSELEKMNDDLAKANAESQAIGDREDKQRMMNLQEIKVLRKEIDQLKKENIKVKKISVARREMLQKIKNQDEKLEAKKLRDKEKRKK